MKLALITGGSKGLGKSLVELYLDNQWEVREFSRSGQSPQNIHCDFSNFSQSTEALELAFFELSKNQWSEIILINNVGTLEPIGPIYLDNAQDWQKNIQINLQSCITTTGLFLKYFDKSTARRYIANISSGAAVKPYFGWSLYCASKAAMESFTACIALEQSQTDNPVIAFIISPGVIDTSMQGLIREQKKSRFKDLEQLKSDQQLQTPNKVAKAVYLIIQQSPTAGEKYNVSDFL